MTEIGSISLDLIVKNTIEAQLERITAKARRPAEKMADSLSRALADNVKLPELPEMNTSANIDVDFPKPDISAFEDIAESLDDVISRAVERMKMPVIEPEIKTPEPVKTKAYVEYDTKQIEAQIDETCRKISEPAEKLSREILEKLGSFDVPTEPVELLRQEINNTYFKLDLLQKKWQELSAADPTDKVCTQLQSVQQQIISTSKTIEKLEGKLADMTAPLDIAASVAFEVKTPELPDISEKLNTVEKSASKTASTIGNKLCKSLKTAEKTGSSLLDTVGKKLGKLSSPIAKFGRNIKRAFKSVFLMAGVYTAFRALKDGLSQAALADEKFARSLNEVKANLAVAFQPIIQSVMPALNTLMDGLARTAKAAASFISGLFGTTYDKAAQAAKKLRATTEATKKAKLSVAGIDEMNILSKDDGTKNDPLSSLTGGEKKAEDLGAKVRTALSEAFDKVSSKAKSTFTKAAKWATTSFAPTFAGIWDGLKTETRELRETLGGIFADIKTLGEPLKAYFSGDFTDFLRNCFDTCGMIAVGLFDTFKTVFSDIWSIAVFPMLQSFISDGLPTVTQFAAESVKTFGTLFSEVKKTFDKLWKEAARPVLSLISKMWSDLMSSLKKFWDKWGEPIFTKLREAIANAGETFRKVWDNFLKPVFDSWAKKFDEVWTSHIKPFIDNFLDFVGTLIDGALEIYNKCISPLVQWFAEKLGPPIAKVLSFILEKWGDVVGGIWDAASGIIDILKGIVNFVVGVFTGDWERAWNGVKDIFKGIWDTFVSIVKIPINAIIDLVNGLVGAVEKALNGILSSIGDKLKIDIPDNVPVIGGTHFSLDVPTVDIPRIPHLAKGGIAAQPTLAMIGDNRNARTDPEVVAPLSKLREIGGSGEIIALLNVIIELLRDGTNIEIVNYLFQNSEELRRIVLNIVRDDRSRGGI